MKSAFNTKRLVMAALCMALCVVLPLAFHSVANAGSIFLPMHIPVLLCGLICSWPLGLVCGIVGPILSSLITGMPPLAYLPPMMVELAVYGLAAGWMMQVVRTKKLWTDLYISLCVAMLAGRVAAGIVKALIFAPGQMSFALWAGSYFVTGLPGIAIQLALIPVIVFALEKAHVVPQRYPLRSQGQETFSPGDSREDASR